MNIDVSVLSQCKVKKITEENPGFILSVTYLVSRKVMGDFERPSTIHYFYNAGHAQNGYPEYFGLWGFAALNTQIWKAKMGSLVRITFNGRGEMDDEGKTPWLCDVEILKNTTINADIFQNLRDLVGEFRQYIAAQSNMITDSSDYGSAKDDKLPF